MPWSTRFAEPIPMPKGEPLVTLKDAADFHKAAGNRAAASAWQTAVEALILVAETDGPMMFARFGIMRAINRHKPDEFSRSTKPRPQSER